VRALLAPSFGAEIAALRHGSIALVPNGSRPVRWVGRQVVRELDQLLTPSVRSGGWGGAAGLKSWLAGRGTRLPSCGACPGPQPCTAVTALACAWRSAARPLWLPLGDQQQQSGGQGGSSRTDQLHVSYVHTRFATLGTRCTHLAGRRFARGPAWVPGWLALHQFAPVGCDSAVGRPNRLIANFALHERDPAMLGAPSSGSPSGECGAIPLGSATGGVLPLGLPVWCLQGLPGGLQAFQTAADFPLIVGR